MTAPGLVVEARELSKVYRRFLHKNQFRTLKSAILTGSLLSDLSPEETFTALDGVSFEVKKGSAFGVIGENGSGKSTLLKLLAGITKPTRGRLQVEGRISALIELGAGFHPEISGSRGALLVPLAAFVFIAPYFFLSALGGELADRYDKAVVARRLKLVEIGVALIAVLGFGLHSVSVLFLALLLVGVIAALFGPIKYGILPDHLARSELPAGNALVEGATFIAILLGTIVGGIAAKDGGDPAKFAVLMIVFSLLCWGASLFIPRTAQLAALWSGIMVFAWFWIVHIPRLHVSVSDQIAVFEALAFAGLAFFLASAPASR